MTFRLLRLVVLSAVLSTAALAQWQAGPVLPTGGAAREAGVAVKKNGVIYLFGGKPFDLTGDSPVHVLASTQTSWSTTTPLENDFLYHGAALDSLGRHIVWFGLDSGGGEGDSYEWTVADGNAGGIAQPSSQAAFQLFAQARDDAGLVYTIGGSLSATQGAVTPVTGRVERYDGAADSWSAVAPMPTPVSDAAACNDGMGHILVLGGFTAAGARTANVARYDVASNTWSDTVVADLPVALSGLRAVRGADGRIYAIGGSNGSNQNGTWILDLMTNTWIAGPAMASARQRFGCAIDDAGWIWAMGGSSTNGVEKLFTPTLPNIVEEPAASHAYLGGPAGFSLLVTGTAPFSFQWRRNGIAISDGATGTGSTLVGAQTASLGIQLVGFGDLGSYDCQITNAAGTVTTVAAPLNLDVPRAIPDLFAATVLHSGPSVAYDVDDGLIGGTISYSHPQWGTLSKPVSWTGAPGSLVDHTPANSVGGAITAVRNGTLVGWWWWPYTNQYGTGYNKHAAIWPAAGGFVNAQSSGWEYGGINDTDGSHHVGTQTYDDASTNSHGFYWPGNSSSAQGLTPPADWGSSAAAIDDGKIYGSVHIGYGVVRAARWQPGSSAWVDMSPPGSSRAYVSSAGDDQQVGSAFWGNSGGSGLFANSGASFLAFPNATLSDCEGGLQVGTAVVNGVSGAKIWAGNPNTMFDLHQFLPANFTSSQANAIDVAVDGTITVVGSAHDSATGLTQAVMWQGQSPSLWQDTEQISASAGGVFHMFIDAGPSVAGQVYAIVGSASGTMPGVIIGNNQLLPLNPDFYLDQTILYPNTWIVPSFSYLDGTGRQFATATLPAGALYVVYPVTIHHALVVISANGSGFDLISGPVALTITP